MKIGRRTTSEKTTGKKRSGRRVLADRLNVLWVWSVGGCWSLRTQTLEVGPEHERAPAQCHDPSGDVLAQDGAVEDHRCPVKHTHEYIYL
jgi:hypothetical protein